MEYPGFESCLCNAMGGGGGGVYVENNNIIQSLSMLHAGNSHNLNEGCLPANPVYGFLMWN